MEAAGSAYTMSTWATCDIEEVVAAAPTAPKWFQLYLYKVRFSEGGFPHVRIKSLRNTLFDSSSVLTGCKQFCLDAVVRSIVFTTTTVARVMVQLPPKLSYCARGETMLHDNYLCLVESNNQQIVEIRSKIQAENSETDNS